MLIIVSLLLVAAALSVVMLLVLASLLDSGAGGVREWSAANALAVAALPLFAARGHVPDWLSIELANTLLLATSAAMLAGFRRHLGLPVPWRRLGACVALGFLVVVLLHRVVDLIMWRVVAMSLLHGAFSFEIALALRRWPGHGSARYPRLLAAAAGFANAGGQWLRAAITAAEQAGWRPPLDETTLSLAFFSCGALALTALTLGAVTMANADLVARARHAADHDHLTGARSRRAFFEHAERERAHGARGRPLSLLLFDVDHFKRINDTHGHATGDRVLVEIVQRASAAMRGIDTVARLGGEEFAVLLPDTGEASALVAAERLRRAMSRSPATGTGHGVHYTVSVGVATLLSQESIDTLLSRADAALYAAKAGGRDMVVVAGDLPGAEEALRLRA